MFYLCKITVLKNKRFLWIDCLQEYAQNIHIEWWRSTFIEKVSQNKIQYAEHLFMYEELLAKLED